MHVYGQNMCGSSDTDIMKYNGVITNKVVYYKRNTLMNNKWNRHCHYRYMINEDATRLVKVKIKEFNRHKQTPKK